MTLIVDPFWYNDITILWNKNRLTEFFPTRDQTLEEKFNAIVRLSIYCFIVLFFNKNDIKYIYLAFGTMLLTYYVYFNREKEQFDPLNQPNNQPNQSVFDNKSQIVKEEKKDEKGDEKKQTLPINCTRPTIDNPFMNVTMKDYFNIDKSTKTIIDRPEACDTSDQNIQKEINNSFNNNLFKDVNDNFIQCLLLQFQMHKMNLPNGYI